MTNNRQTKMDPSTAHEQQAPLDPAARAGETRVSNSGLKLDVTTVLQAIGLAGSALPAFKALFDAALTTFSPADQTKLDAAYARARDKSDLDHEDIQHELAKAAKG